MAVIGCSMFSLNFFKFSGLVRVGFHHHFDLRGRQREEHASKSEQVVETSRALPTARMNTSNTETSAKSLKYFSGLSVNRSFAD